MAKKRQSAVELARSGSSEVERMAGRPLYLVEGEHSHDADVDEPIERHLETQQPVSDLMQDNTQLIDGIPEELTGKSNVKVKAGAKTEDRNIEVLEKERSVPSKVAETVVDSTPNDEKLYRLPLETVKVGGINTRVIDEESQPFKELVESIQKDGQLAPVLVGIEGDGYRLIAGERRYRAVRAAGFTTVLARVTQAPVSEWAGLMLIENLMRQDLSIWEEASGYKALLTMGLSQDEVGARVHKGKTHVSLILKIMRNPTLVAAVDEGAVTSESMVKELSALIDNNGHEIIPGSIEKALDFIAKRGPTVHELRAWVRTLTQGLQDTGAGKKLRRGTRRGTFLKTEQMRLNAVVEKIADLSTVEISLLAKIYEEQANILRKISEQPETHITKEDSGRN